MKWKHILGAGFPEGIGFTMSIFIALLAYSDSGTIDSSKIAILVASCFAAIIGFILLKGTLHTSISDRDENSSEH